MIDFADWVKSHHFPDKPWMVIGKGPTYAQINKVGIEGYNTISLNHVVRERKVDIAHIIDIDVVEACAEELRTNCDWLMMPKRPNVSSLPSEFLTIEDWINSIPILRELEDQGKLVCYDIFIGTESDDPWQVPVLYFSSEAALGVLARMGIKKVRSIGVDGGRKYNPTFADLDSETKLINGQPSFDLQFERLEKIASDFSLDYGPIIEPMLVFVGADESQTLPAQVLEYSIHKHASRPVRVIPMIDLKVRTPKDEKNRPRTGFSFYRFAIPKLAGYKGRALYVDSDMQVFTDLAELWDIEFGEQKILCTTQTLPEAWKDNAWAHPGRQYSVMLLDCSRLNWDIDEIIDGLDQGKFTYGDLLFDMCLVKPHEIEDRIPPRWNCLEHYEEGQSSLLHYTVVPTQPWLVDENPLCQIWVNELEEAVRTGWITRRQIEWNLEKGYLRKSLAYVADLARNQSAEGKPVPDEGPCSGPSAHLQQLVKAYRKAVWDTHLARQNETTSRLKELESMRIAKKATLELTETQEKLQAALAETDRFRRHLDDTIKTTKGVEEEYRHRVTELESAKQSIYSSRTWKLGRLFTKPVEILKKN
jgi:Glycosyl transferase family 8